LAEQFPQNKTAALMSATKPGPSRFQTFAAPEAVTAIRPDGGAENILYRLPENSPAILRITWRMVSVHLN
jgi:hypothetical protein